MKVQCQIWVGRINLLSSENSSLHLFVEVHLHVWVKQSNLNSSYKINISLVQGGYDCYSVLWECSFLVQRNNLSREEWVAAAH